MSYTNICFSQVKRFDYLTFIHGSNTLYHIYVSPNARFELNATDFITSYKLQIMAFLDWFSSTALPEFWSTLETEADVRNALKKSHHQPIAFFKHSTRCGTSHHVMSELTDQSQKIPHNIPIYYLDLIAHRDLSRMIAEELDLAHQSPQLIIVHKGQVITHASHHAIDWARMATEVSTISPS